MAFILIKNPKRNTSKERIVILTRAQLINFSKAPCFTSVVKTAKQQLTLRNNFLKLPNVYEEGDEIIIKCYDEETRYSRMSKQVCYRTLLCLEERGGEAMNLMHLLSHMSGRNETKFRISAPWVYRAIGGRSRLSAEIRRKCNVLIDLIQAYFPEFQCERTYVHEDGMSGLGKTPTYCLEGHMMPLEDSNIPEGVLERLEGILDAKRVYKAEIPMFSAVAKQMPKKALEEDIFTWDASPSEQQKISAQDFLNDPTLDPTKIEF